VRARRLQDAIAEVDAPTLAQGATSFARDARE
jgi:hypothetical protein